MTAAASSRRRSRDSRSMTPSRSPAWPTRDDVNAYLSAADIVAVPSVHADGFVDGQPNVALEAMAAAQAARRHATSAACRISSRTGENGLIVEERDRMRSPRRSSPSRATPSGGRAMGGRGTCARCSDELNWDAYADRLVDIYERRGTRVIAPIARGSAADDVYGWLRYDTAGRLLPARRDERSRDRRRLGLVGVAARAFISIRRARARSTSYRSERGRSRLERRAFDLPAARGASETTSPSTCVCAFEVLEHLERRPSHALAGWLRHVAPGGSTARQRSGRTRRCGPWDARRATIRRYDRADLVACSGGKP